MLTITRLSRCANAGLLCRAQTCCVAPQYRSIRFTAYYAGHVLGAAMFLIEIGGVKVRRRTRRRPNDRPFVIDAVIALVQILYTGDYSREEDRHLMAAELPDIKPDVLIIESTFGVQVRDAAVVELTIGLGYACVCVTQVHEPRRDRERRFTSCIRCDAFVWLPLFRRTSASVAPCLQGHCVARWTMSDSGICARTRSGDPTDSR